MGRTRFISGHIVRVSTSRASTRFFAGIIEARRMLMSFTHFSSGVYSTHHSTDDSKVEFRWCYNQLISIFIMKIRICSWDSVRAKTSQLYIDTKKPDASSRRIWLEKRNNKNMFKFLLCFYLLNCVSRKQSFIPYYAIPLNFLYNSIGFCQSSSILYTSPPSRMSMSTPLSLSSLKMPSEDIQRSSPKCSFKIRHATQT